MMRLLWALWQPIRFVLSLKYVRKVVPVQCSDVKLTTVQCSVPHCDVQFHVSIFNQSSIDKDNTNLDPQRRTTILCIKLIYIDLI
jgi:hypothetical protein